MNFPEEHAYLERDVDKNILGYPCREMVKAFFEAEPDVRCLELIITGHTVEFRTPYYRVTEEARRAVYDQKFIGIMVTYSDTEFSPEIKELRRGK